MVPVNAPGVPDRSECHDMELSDLKIFKAVVDEGGIIRAGRALHRVPSNVSARVKQLVSQPPPRASSSTGSTQTLASPRDSRHMAGQRPCTVTVGGAWTMTVTASDQRASF